MSGSFWRERGGAGAAAAAEAAAEEPAIEVTGRGGRKRGRR